MRLRKTWALPDSHFNHDKLWMEGYRPRDFNERIIANCQRLINPGDTVIHLGDVILGRNGTLGDIMKQLPGMWGLVRGNHDHESDSWYMRKGFTFVCHGLHIGGIWLTHEPAYQLPDGAIINVHGHLHGQGNTHRGDPKLLPKHCKLLALEDTDYCPVELNKFVGFSPTRQLLLGQVPEDGNDEADHIAARAANLGSRQSIVCPACGKESFNPNDVKHRYCGNCNAYYDDQLEEPVMKIEYVTQLGMALERWTHESCEAEFGTGEDWATLYDIQSKEQGQGHATTLLRSAKMYYEERGKRFGSTVPLNEHMRHILKKLDIEVRV